LKRKAGPNGGLKGERLFSKYFSLHTIFQKYYRYYLYKPIHKAMQKLVIIIAMALVGYQAQAQKTSKIFPGGGDFELGMRTSVSFFNDAGYIGRVTEGNSAYASLNV
jgi:hypothetical protein